MSSTRGCGPQWVCSASLPDGSSDRLFDLLQEFGLKHLEVLLKIQGLGSPFHLVEVEAASGFLSGRQGSTQTLLT